MRRSERKWLNWVNGFRSCAGELAVPQARSLHPATAVQPIRICSMLQRLRATPSTELSFRAKAMIRTQMQRVAIALRGTKWDRARIAEVLAHGVLGADAECAVERE